LKNHYIFLCIICVFTTSCNKNTFTHSSSNQDNDIQWKSITIDNEALESNSTPSVSKDLIEKEILENSAISSKHVLESQNVRINKKPIVELKKATKLNLSKKIIFKKIKSELVNSRKGYNKVVNGIFLILGGVVVCIIAGLLADYLAWYLVFKIINVIGLLVMLLGAWFVLEGLTM